MAKNKELSKIDLYVTSMMNELQGEHANLLLKLRSVAGKTQEYENIVKILNQIFEAKIDILDKIHKEIQIYKTR